MFVLNQKGRLNWIKPRSPMGRQRPGVSTRQPADQTRPSAFFGEQSFTGTGMPILLCTVVKETVWLTESQVCTIWPFTEKAGNSCYRRHMTEKNTSWKCLQMQNFIPKVLSSHLQSAPKKVFICFVLFYLLFWKVAGESNPPPPKMKWTAGPFIWEGFSPETPVKSWYSATFTSVALMSLSPPGIKLHIYR